MSFIMVTMPKEQKACRDIKTSTSKYDGWWKPEEVRKRANIASRRVYKMTMDLISAPSIQVGGEFSEFYTCAYNLVCNTKAEACPIKGILSRSIHEGATTLLVKFVGTPDECRTQFERRIRQLIAVIMHWVRPRMDSNTINELAEASWEKALKEVRAARYVAVMEAGLNEHLAEYITNMTLPCKA